MKRILSFVILIVLVTLQAQTPSEILLNNTWRFVEYYYECFGGGPFDSNEFGTVELHFSQNDGITHFQSQMCATASGTLELLTDSEISFSNTNIDGERCFQANNELYESCYFSTFYNNFNYQITENQDGSLDLILSNDIFMGIKFTTQKLSTQETSENPMYIYPNPIKDKLTIDNLDLKITHIKITDVTGKLIIEQNIYSNKIDLNFSKYPKGIYFLIAESKGKIIKTEKIIKN